MISFDDFWLIVPRKAGSKKKAKAAWSRLSKSKKQLAYDDIQIRYLTTDKPFIPYPTTYLNGEYWECEIEVKNEGKHGTHRQDSRAGRVSGKLRDYAMQDMPKKWIAAIFQRFQAIYLHKFTSAIEGIEETAMNEWAKELAHITPDQVKDGLEKIPDDWPPTAKEFRRLCESRTGNASFKPFAPALPRPKVDPDYVDSLLGELREKLK